MVSLQACRRMIMVYVNLVGFMGGAYAAGSFAQQGHWGFALVALGLGLANVAFMFRNLRG